MQGNNSFVIRILIVNGNPNGVRIITRSNWNGYGAIVPRSMLGEVKDDKRIRPIIDQAGVYILRAFPTDSAQPAIYIGEAESVLRRLEEHAKGRGEGTRYPALEEWVDSFIFVSPELNKAYIQYIEAWMIERATAARQAHLANRNRGRKRGRLTPADEAVADEFINAMMLCLETMGITYFSALPDRKGAEAENSCVIQQRDIRAEGLYDGSAFWVKKGSVVSKDVTVRCPTRYKELRDQLVREGVLQERDNYLVFTRDFRFDSPSAAAAVVLGRAANGWIEWKRASTGQTLDDLIRAQVSTAQSEDGDSETDAPSGTLSASNIDEAGGDE